MSIAAIAVLLSGAFASSDRQQSYIADRVKGPAMIDDSPKEQSSGQAQRQIQVAEILEVSPSALQPPAPGKESSVPLVINPDPPKPPEAKPAPEKNAGVTEVINPGTSSSTVDTLQNKDAESPAAGVSTGPPLPSPVTSEYSSSCVDVSDASGWTAEGGSSVIIRKRSLNYDIIFELQDCSVSPASDVEIIENPLCKGGHLQIEGRICTVGAPGYAKKK